MAIKVDGITRAEVRDRLGRLTAVQRREARDTRLVERARSMLAVLGRDEETASYEQMSDALAAASAEWDAPAPAPASGVDPDDELRPGESLLDYERRMLVKHSGVSR